MQSAFQPYERNCRDRRRSQTHRLPKAGWEELLPYNIHSCPTLDFCNSNIMGGTWALFGAPVAELGEGELLPSRFDEPMVWILQSHEPTSVCYNSLANQRTFNLLPRTIHRFKAFPVYGTHSTQHIMSRQLISSDKFPPKPHNCMCSNPLPHKLAKADPPAQHPPPKSLASSSAQAKQRQAKSNKPLSVNFQLRCPSASCTLTSTIAHRPPKPQRSARALWVLAGAGREV